MDFYITALIQGLCFSSLALGIFISMKIFNIPDITTDGSYTLGGVVTAMLLSNQVNVFLILPLVILAGALAGVCTALVHTKLKINPLLSGILVMTALYSINLSIMGRSNVPLLNYPGLYSAVILSDDLNLNTLFILLLFVGALTAFMSYLLKTDFGISMRATGNSESMIRAFGVDTDQMKVIGLAIANALTAASGFLVSQFQGFADINMGIGIVIVGLGSVIIAETFIIWLHVNSIMKTLMLVISGAVLFQLILSFTLSLGVDPAMLKLVTALCVLVIVSLPRLVLKRTVV